MPNAALRALRPFLMAVLFVMSEPVFATAQRTFVSSTGNDVHPCSITSPCRGFAAAVAQTNAGGEVIVLDSAGYGAVMITQSVSIIAPTGIYAGISVFSGDGVKVNAPGAIVVLRGLLINGQGGTVGINLQQAARLRIETCVISAMSGTGIQHAAPGAEMIVLDTIVRDNSTFGIAITVGSTVVLDHVRSEHNGARGLVVSAPPSSTSSTTIADSVFAANGQEGIIAIAGGLSTVDMQVERTVISNNGAAGFAASAASSGVATVTLTRNTVGVNGGDGILLSASSSGSVLGFLMENSVHKAPGHSIHSAGNGAFIHVGANTAFSLFCDGGGILESLGNNLAAIGGPIGCYSTVTGL